MSTAENITLWKKRAEIDYIPIFISLWFSLNAWMKDRQTTNSTDRNMLESLKRGGNRLSNKFADLMQATDSNGKRFTGNFGELHRALVNARIPYVHNNLQGQIISFDACPVSWNSGSPQLESVLKTKYQKEKIKIDDSLWVENDTDRVFAAYIEIVYQIRCTLFHGDLAPKPENERVIRQLYLTLSMIMEHV